MRPATVLVTDPIGGDVSIIATTLRSRGIQTIVPFPDESWHVHADKADGLIVNLTGVDAESIVRLSRCRVIARLGVGINNIDVAAAAARGIVVTNVPDYCREEVSDHALAMILALVRKLPLANAKVHSGAWDQLGFRPIHRLNTQVLGLVGFGRLAKRLAEKAGVLGMRVIAYDPHVQPDPSDAVTRMPFEAVLREADIVSLHAPLLPETRAMIGRSAIRAMKRGAVLINTSRGELIDEAALLEALDDGHLSAVALDVAAVEPLPASSPLRNRFNVLLTPHMAFYSEESLMELQVTAADDVARALSGESPRHRAA